MTGPDIEQATARLSALRANLSTRGLTTRLDVCDQGRPCLAVLNPDGDDQVDTITCMPRSADGGRWWFWDCTGQPIAEADHVTEAGVITVGTLAKSGIYV